MQGFHKQIWIAAVLTMVSISGCSSETGNPTPAAEASTTSEAEPDTEKYGLWFIAAPYPKKLLPKLLVSGEAFLLDGTPFSNLFYRTKAQCEAALNIYKNDSKVRKLKEEMHGDDIGNSFCVKDNRYSY